jgi:hypothetical protein
LFGEALIKKTMAVSQSYKAITNKPSETWLQSVYVYTLLFSLLLLGANRSEKIEFFE